MVFFVTSRCKFAKIQRHLFIVVTNNEIKRVRQLHQKKYRLQHGYFIVEGVKLVRELLAEGWQVNALYATESVVPIIESPLVQQVTSEQMSRMSMLRTPPGVLAVAVLPDVAQHADPSIGWTLALDQLRDPGNLGTILRTADWFGIQQVVLSNDCVEVHNPKVVQASMGSLFRVKISVVDLPLWLAEVRNQSVEVFAADMEGNDFSAMQWPEKGILVVGSESHGVSEEVKSAVSTLVNIPRRGGSESLNVAVATGIICSRLPVQ